MRVAVLLCLLVLLAGCGGTGVGGPPATDPPPTASPSDRDTSSPSPTGATPGPTPTEVPTRTPAPTRSSVPDLASTPDRDSAPDQPSTAAAGPSSNPWDARPVTVRISAPANDTREYRPLVERTLRFWEAEPTGYDLTYRLTDDADADVTVRFVATVTGDGCGGPRSVGCAPLIERGDPAVEPTVVRIETGYTDASTLDTLKHEFGHTLGYGHDDTDRYEFMAATDAVTRLPATDATARENPWGDDSLLVYVAYPDVVETQRSDYESAVERAFAFYRTDERSTLPPGTSLDLTTNRSAADVVIDISTGGPFRSAGGRYGVDTDADDALERFERYEIELADVDRDRVAWHVGYWLGWAFGAESEADLPDPFDDPETDDREDWE